MDIVLPQSRVEKNKDNHLYDMIQKYSSGKIDHEQYTPQVLVDRTLCCSLFFFFFFLTSTFFHINNIFQLSMYHWMTYIQSNSTFYPCRVSDMI
jgi:hypothetical protein